MEYSERERLIGYKTLMNLSDRDVMPRVNDMIQRLKKLEPNERMNAFNGWVKFCEDKLRTLPFGFAAERGKLITAKVLFEVAVEECKSEVKRFKGHEADMSQLNKMEAAANDYLDRIGMFNGHGQRAVEDLLAKIQKAKDAKGESFGHQVDYCVAAFKNVMDKQNWRGADTLRRKVALEHGLIGGGSYHHQAAENRSRRVAAGHTSTTSTERVGISRR
jgi:hypothetical protein